MLLKKYVKNRRKLKILLLLMVVVLLVVTVVVLNISPNAGASERLLDERFIARVYGQAKLEQPPPLLKSPRENGVIVPEKYDEQRIRARIMQDKLKTLKQQQQQQQKFVEPGDEHTVLDTVTNAVHIFYSAPVQWYKTKKTQHAIKELLNEEHDNASTTTVKPVRILNTAFYPALGLYKPTANLLRKHLDNIRNCGIGVLILSYTGKDGEAQLHSQLMTLASSYNLSVTYEISVAGNQSMEFLRQQLTAMSELAMTDGFYSVYSQRRKALVPVIYVNNAYKLGETAAGRALCDTQPNSLRRIFNGYLIGHIRLKGHAEIMRRLCFEGFYSKLPSNGATFASTWKNWSYLKSFALMYKMLFVPTVGPGFAERNKFPRHGDIQRHRSNGRYYGVAWRTAIVNHVGFINVASYNNWPDGSQIEEVIPKAGFLDYNPGSKTKYLDLTAHWVANFLKTRHESAVAGVGGQPNCYELLNNTIC